MKHTILAAFCLTTFAAHATNYSNPLQGASANSHSAAIAIQGQALHNQVNVQGASNGSISNGNGDVTLHNDYDSERIPVNSAIAPSLTQNIICPIISPNSHAVQFLVFGGSTTGGQSLNAECVAYHLGQKEILEQMTCAKSEAYRKANQNCK